MARLKIGFIPIEGGHYYTEALEEVTKAEELGFDSVWMEEHHSVTNHYWPSPLVVLAGFATRTSRLMLGTDILVAAFHNPVRLAEDAAVLDVMSGGRFTLGIAIGYMAAGAYLLVILSVLTLPETKGYELTPTIDPVPTR